MPVRTAEIDQRIRNGALEAKHFADEHHMVATRMARGVAALETRAATVQQRRTTETVIEAQTGETITHPAGESL